MECIDVLMSVIARSIDDFTDDLIDDLIDGPMNRCYLVECPFLRLSIGLFLTHCSR
jgi:hypothetical protein